MTFALVVSRNSSAQVGTDWTTTKDRTSSYQISVPKSWGQPVTLVKGMGKVGTFSPETQKMVSERMLENTEKRVFYILKSTPTPGAKPSTTYQVSIPGDGFHCTAQLIVQRNFIFGSVRSYRSPLVRDLVGSRRSLSYPLRVELSVILFATLGNGLPIGGQSFAIGGRGQFIRRYDLPIQFVRNLDAVIV